jgi:hypothetical protein
VGKSEGEDVPDLKAEVLPLLLAVAVAVAVKEEAATETLFKVLRHLAANGRVKVHPGATLFDDQYSVS